MFERSVKLTFHKESYPDICQNVQTVSADHFPRSRNYGIDAPHQTLQILHTSRRSIKGMARTLFTLFKSRRSLKLSGKSSALLMVIDFPVYGVPQIFRKVPEESPDKN
jgi:hypothetical protein